MDIHQTNEGDTLNLYKNFPTLGEQPKKSNGHQSVAGHYRTYTKKRADYTRMSHKAIMKHIEDANDKMQRQSQGRLSINLLARAQTGSEEVSNPHDYVGFQIQNSRQQKAKLLARASQNLNKLRMQRASMTHLSTSSMSNTATTKYTRSQRRSLSLVGTQSMMMNRRGKVSTDIPSPTRDDTARGFEVALDSPGADHVG